MMDYVYVVMWLIIGIYLIISAKKLGNILYFCGTFFMIFGGWKLADILLEAELFKGVYGIVFRVITAVFLGICVIAYIQNKRKEKEKDKAE